MIDHPLIYCNGDSYSDKNYHKTLNEKTYAHVVGSHLGGYVINNAITGSCNRRIIRSSCHDLIQQRELNPEQKIFALLGLSFELRSELWHENTINNIESESNFQTNVFTKKNNWRDMLLTGKDINKTGKEFLDKYNQGYAYYYSPYAERINLMCDLVMFQSLMQQLDIKFLVFQSPKSEKLEQEYLLDFFKSRLHKENFIDFETFGFVYWCFEQKFTPLDMLDRPEIAHYGADAHRAFAEQILLPRIEKL